MPLQEKSEFSSNKEKHRHSQNINKTEKNDQMEIIELTITIADIKLCGWVQ